MILDTIAYNCNTSNVAGHGGVSGHNNAIFDFVGSHLFIGNGSNCNAIWMDGPSCISVSNGLTISNTFGDVVHFDEGGKGSFSGVIAPSGTTSVARLFNLRACAAAFMGTQPQTTGYASIGPSLVDGNSVMYLNGVTIPGGAITSTHGGQVI